MTWWLMGAGGDKPLTEYLNNLGLSDVEPTPESKPVTKEEALKIADNILKMQAKKVTD